METFFTITVQLSKGMSTSLQIFALTLLFSIPLGLFVAFGRMSKHGLLRGITKVYISVMRGTPLMLQLYAVYFGPYILLGLPLTIQYRATATIIAFSINYAAYFAEIYRSGIESMPSGQYEAAEVLGLGKIHTFVRIILPQVIKRILPSITNEIITLVKDTSLAYAIAYTEMFTLAKQISSARGSLVPVFVAGLFYYIFNFVVAFIMERVEKRLSYYEIK